MFDARAAKALQAGQHLTVPGAPGLRLEATPSTRTWTYRFKSPVDGRMRQIRLGRWPAMGFPAALAAWERVKAQRDAGADPAAEKRAKAATTRTAAYSVRKACDDYLADYQGRVAPRTFAEAERMLAVDIVSIADKAMASITRADAFDLISGMRDRPVQAGRLRQLLGAVWDRAHDAGRLPPEVPNWWRLVLRGKLASQGKPIGGERSGVVKRVLSEDELAALLPWLPNFSRDVDDGLTLYLWTACRGAEIVAMEAQDISEEDDGLWWTVPKAKVKMRRHPLVTDLRVPLAGRAAAIVRRRLAAHPEGWLFPSGSREGHVQQKALGVATWMHSPRCELRPEWVRPRLPVADFAPHDLRRTARTLLAALGCPGEVAEAILGHLQPGVQAVYNRHGYDAERREWLTRLSAHLESIAGRGQDGGRRPAATAPRRPAQSKASRRAAR
jgi:integrase